MEAKHTPGPLIVTHRIVIERPVKIREHFAIAPIAGPTLAFLPEGRPDIQRANAHLFAASSELLTELIAYHDREWREDQEGIPAHKAGERPDECGACAVIVKAMGNGR